MSILDKTTKQVLDRTLKKNPEQLADVCLDMWKNRDITIQEYKSYGWKCYKTMRKIRRKAKVRELLRRLFQ